MVYTIHLWYVYFTDKAVPKEKVEECFAHVINTIDNEEVAKALRYCGLLCHSAWESLKQALTTYRISCLIVKIILWMKKADFDKLCDVIKNEKQVKQISELYHGKHIASQCSCVATVLGIVRNCYHGQLLCITQLVNMVR